MKVLVVDDHALIREALHGVIRELMEDAFIVEASDAQGALRCIEEHADLELILLDLYLPGRSGFEILNELHDRFPALCVVVLSASCQRDDITRALDSGALGFIPKSASREIMLSALRLVLAGGVYVPPEVFGRVQAAPLSTSHPGQNPSAMELGLTERQLEVLLLMMQGRSNKGICRALDLAEPTVKNHVTAILKALNARNRTEAVVIASTLGVGPTTRNR
jgi:DNA-binding NarL/FixJ family response regulator